MPIPSDVDSNGIRATRSTSPGLEPSEEESKDLIENVEYAYSSPDRIHVASSIEELADWAD